MFSLATILALAMMVSSKPKQLESLYEGWVQIDLTPGLNVCLRPCDYLSRDVFKQTIEDTLASAYARLGWDYSPEEIHNHAVYFTILYKDLYTK